MCHGTQEQNTTAKGTWEEIWAHRRSKGPLLRRTRGGGGTAIGISFLMHALALREWGTSGAGMGSERPLAWATEDLVSLVWASGDPAPLCVG